VKKLLALFFIGFAFQNGFACTTFFINDNGHLVFGRNYDWVTGNGMINTNQQGLYKTSFKTPDGLTTSWISKYGSVTFNQYGKEFPTGGINEKGLVVELMWLDGTVYPNPDQRPAMGVLQWIQYNLDNCSSVAEVIMQDNNIRIASKGTTPLHYLIADAGGNVAVIEFLDGKMVVHTGKDLPFPVLTNDRYDYSMIQAKTKMDQENFTRSSLDRFARVCQKINRWDENKKSLTVIDYSLNTLHEVAQENTQWSIVYDITEKKIYFRSAAFPVLKYFSFADFDFKCSSIPLALEINQAGNGDVRNDFQAYSSETNASSIDRSAEQSNTQIQLSKETMERLKAYPVSPVCRL
jgi:choloylglycine hydrolase